MSVELPNPVLVIEVNEILLSVQSCFVARKLNCASLGAQGLRLLSFNWGKLEES